jgi:hypothetical protein
MVRIDKQYYDLEEVSARWRMRIRDLGYLAENGDLRVSTRVECARLERGTIEIDRGQEFRIPHEQEWFSGVKRRARITAGRGSFGWKTELARRRSVNQGSDVPKSLTTEPKPARSRAGTNCKASRRQSIAIPQPRPAPRQSAVPAGLL